MLDKMTLQSMQLEIGERKINFSSLADFEFCLSARTTIPMAKLVEIMGHSSSQLQKESRVIKGIEKQFILILGKSIGDLSCIKQLLDDINLSTFSQDHQWRDIMAGLRESDKKFNCYRRLALVKYLQYLSSRQEAIKYAYFNNENLSNKAQEGEQQVPSEDEYKETLILDSELFEWEKGDSKRDVFERMPKGEPFVVTLAADDVVSVVLSRHSCKIGLDAEAQPVFIDHTGREYSLVSGENKVGRGSGGDIILDASLRDISRTHLVIENLGDNTLKIVDLSSHGTYVDPKVLEQQSPWD